MDEHISNPHLRRRSLCKLSKPASPRGEHLSGQRIVIDATAPSITRRGARGLDFARLRLLCRLCWLFLACRLTKNSNNNEKRLSKFTTSSPVLCVPSPASLGTSRVRSLCPFRSLSLRPANECDEIWAPVELAEGSSWYQVFQIRQGSGGDFSFPDESRSRCVECSDIFCQPEVVRVDTSCAALFTRLHFVGVVIK